MPILCALFPNTCISFGMEDSISMPPIAPTRNGEAHLRPKHPTASVFIILSAKAFSSVGFGLSILAIWLSWALPTGVLSMPPRVAEPSVAPLHNGHRRSRSIGSKHRSRPPRRLSAPIHLPPAPILGLLEKIPPSNPNRHVSFADPYPPSIRRNPVPTENINASDSNALPPSDSHLFSNLFLASPPITTAPLPSPNSLPTPPPEEAVPLPSESTRPSTALCQGRPSSPVFSKLRLSFHSKRKRKRVQGDNVPDSPTPSELSKDSTESSVVCRRKLNTFSPLWSHSKKGIPTDPLACLETASTQSKASTSSSTSATSFMLLNKKAQRRTSTPIPRTMPYEAPYFATPPLLLDDSYSAPLRRLPHFEDDLAPPVSPDPSDSTRVRASNASDAGLPRSWKTRTRPISKRRSASEDWTPQTGILAQT